MSARNLGLAAFAALSPALAFLTGCPPTDTTTGDQGDPALVRFQSGDELVSYFKTQAKARNQGLGGAFFRGGDFIAAPAAAEDSNTSGGTGNAADDSGNGSGGASFSTTNIQEEGVDESDVFKSDGEYFYIAKGQTLRIVHAQPADDLAQVAKVDFDAYINELYLYGDKLIAVGQVWSFDVSPMLGMPVDMMYPPYYQKSSTKIYEVDIADPTHPAITATNTVDGTLVSSRLVHDRVVLVLTIVPELPASINAMELSDVLPKMTTSSGEGTLVAPENWYHPRSPDGYFTTAVVTLDAADIESVVASTAVMADAGTIYVSQNALYITDDQYDAADNFRAKTAIHKLAFNDEGVATYSASGSFAGRLLNQFSLGEFEGKLRVAAHIDPVWSIGGGDVAVGVGGGVATDAAPPNAQSREDETTTSDGTVSADAASNPTVASNSVYVLSESNAKLEIVGEIDGIAEGETLYAARFIGERGYLVTFKQIDPLFVLDLSDAENPAVAGELVLPGYSDYLHPVGTDRLIGVGRSTIDTPWGGTAINGVQVSLFDVSDIANPTLVDKVELGGYGSYSDVSYSHKAFTFLADRNLLALPVQLWENTGDPFTDAFFDQGTYFAGVVAFDVDADAGFTEIGRVESVVYDSWNWNAWQRAALIGDDVYAVTPAGVRASNLNDFTQTHAVTLPRNPDEDWNGGFGIEGDGGVSGGGSTEPGSAGGGDDGSTGVSDASSGRR